MDLEKSFGIVLGILISISLGVLLNVYVTEVLGTRPFIINTFFTILLYVIVIYSLISGIMKNKFLIIPRTLVAILMTMFPYMILRYIEIESFTVNNLNIFLYVLFIGGFVWGMLESILNKPEDLGWKKYLWDWKRLQDLRIIAFGVLIILNTILNSNGKFIF